MSLVSRDRFVPGTRVAPVALAIVSMPGLYPTAYRATFPCVFMRLALVCFYCLCVFVYVFYFIATMSVAGYFLSVLFCLLSMLISDSRFDLVWFRLSCDHGWIRSGSVNVRKQQTTTTRCYTWHQCSSLSYCCNNNKHECKCIVCRWASPRGHIVDPMLLPLGNPFKFHEEVLYLQPMIPPKCFDIQSLT